MNRGRKGKPGLFEAVSETACLLLSSSIPKPTRTLRPAARRENSATCETQTYGIIQTRSAYAKLPSSVNYASQKSFRASVCRQKACTAGGAGGAARKISAGRHLGPHRAFFFCKNFAKEEAAPRPAPRIFLFAKCCLRRRRHLGLHRAEQVDGGRRVGNLRAHRRPRRRRRTALRWSFDSPKVEQMN